jgi:dolichol kinase
VNPGLRRLLHASTAAVSLLALESTAALRLGTLALAGSALAFEAVRLRWPAGNALIMNRLQVFRPREGTRVSGAAWLALGYALAAWVPAPGPVAGILAGALADPAASWVGGRWGGGKRKSWPGTAAVAGVTALATWAVGLPLLPTLAAAIGAAALERWSGPLDDNVLVPPGVALVASWLA